MSRCNSGHGDSMNLQRIHFWSQSHSKRLLLLLKTQMAIIQSVSLILSYILCGSSCETSHEEEQASVSFLQVSKPGKVVRVASGRASGVKHFYKNKHATSSKWHHTGSIEIRVNNGLYRCCWQTGFQVTKERNVWWGRGKRVKCVGLRVATLNVETMTGKR